MSESVEFEGALGLADFLTDLRAELAEASKRAKDDSLRLGVEQVTVSLDVAVTLAKKGEAEVRAAAKFWVFASVEGGVKGELSSQRAATQHLTLTLTPRVEEIGTDASGRVQKTSRGLDVSGQMGKQEENPELPVRTE
jgi:hypothetical protein